jgi:hypothetical protein
MNSADHSRLPFSAFILALLIGVFSFAAIVVLLDALGVELVEAYTFAILSGITIACFVWIERSLVFQIKQKERLLALEHARRLEFEDRLYSQSLACFVRFDASNLMIQQATPGFIKMMRLPADTVLRGERLEKILGVNPLKLESIVDSIKDDDASIKQLKIELISADGLVYQALINGQYFPDEHVVEAAFFVPPVKDSERVADLEATKKDLDRFRKGMFRRETRILELKQEINRICQEVNLPIRYHTDLSSDDSQSSLPSSRRFSAKTERSSLS